MTGLIAALAIALAADLETWSDASGDFTVRAEFVSLEGGTVVLKDEAGDELEVPLESLSPESRRLAERLSKAAESPFKKRGKSSPFQKRGDAGRGGINESDRRRGRDAGPAEAPTPTPLKAGRVDVIDADQVTAPLSLTPGEPPPAADLPRAGLTFPLRMTVHDKLLGAAVSPLSGTAAFGYGIHKFSDPAEGGAVTLVDLLRGKAAAPVRTATPEGVCWVSPDGERVLTRRSVFGFGNSAAVTMWDASRGLEAEWSAEPFAELSGVEKDVDWAGSLGGGRAAALHGRGLLRVFDVEARAVTHEGDVPFGARPSVSADGRFFVVPGQRRVAVYDAASLRGVGSVDVEGLDVRAAALTADNARLMVAGARELRVFDAATGELVGSAPHGASVPGESPPLGHAGGPFYFVGGRVVDVERHVPVWTYVSALAPTRIGDETVLFYGGLPKDRGAGLAVAGPLPHATPRRLLEQAAADPNLLALQPGDRVKVDVGPMPDAAERAKLEAALKANAEAAGFAVDPAAGKTLSLTLRRGESRTETYRRFGFGGQSEEVTFRPYVAKLAVLDGGREVWSRESGAGGPGFMISVQDGETMQQAATRLEKPNYEWVGKLAPPTHVPNTTVVGPEGLGSSTLGLRGLQDQPAK